MPNETSKLAKFYLNMESLNIGKALEEGRHCLDFIAHLKLHLQSQDLDAWDDGAWAHLISARLCDVNVQMQRTESEIKITHLIPGQLLNETEGKLGLQFIYCTSMMVLPICSSCCPGGQYPSIRRLGALPILILENLLPPMRRVISRKNLSR